MKKNKLVVPGFTLAELLTVMIISSLVVTLVGYVYFGNQQYFHMVKKRTGQVEDFRRFKAVLAHEVYMSDSVLVIGDSMLFTHDTITHSLSWDSIPRYQVNELYEVFKLPISNFEYQKLGDKLVQSISLTVTMGEQSIKLQYTKNYPYQIIYNLGSHESQGTPAKK